MNKKNNISLYQYGLYFIDVIPKYIKSCNLKKNELILITEESTLYSLINFLKKHLNSNYETLIAITAVDYPNKKKRFEVNYILLSLQYNYRIRVKTSVDEFTVLPSIETIYKSANWYEREVWDMFGIFFSNHSDLRRILTDYGFEGFPLRKDFPQTGYVEVRYDDKKKHVLYEPLEIAQEFRFFDFTSP